MSGSGDGRLARWSQRKHADRMARRGAAAPVAMEDAAPEPQSLPPVPEGNDGEVPADSDLSSLVAVSETAETEDHSAPVDPGELPNIDELDGQSDYSVFLRKGVPEALKRAALAKLWRSDPVFANLDGLNDYDLDYNMVDRLIAAGATDYKVGRGFLEEKDAPVDTANRGEPEEPEGEDDSVQELTAAPSGEPDESDDVVASEPMSDETSSEQV